MHPLLLLHGAVGSRSQFENLTRLLEKDFEVYRIDFSGHGESDTTAEQFSIELFANDVHAFLAKEKIESIDIFGYSMGGYVAMYLAKQFPEKVKSLITLGTKFNWDSETANKEAKMLDPEGILANVPAFAEILAQRHSGHDWKNILQKTTDMMLALGEEASLKASDYVNIRMPVMLMLGDRDKMVTLEETVNVYKTLPGGALAILPKSPHPIEQVDQTMIAWHIRKFFKKD